MSYVNQEILKGNLDPTIPFFTTSQNFTTAVISIDALSQFGAYLKAFRIQNNDAANNLLYRQGGLSEPQKVLPPASEIVVEGWESFIEITPNGATGTGSLEMDLIIRKDAEKNGR